jgi:hypothetical protein
MQLSAIGPPHALERYHIGSDVHGPLDESDGIAFAKADHEGLRTE